MKQELNQADYMVLTGDGDDSGIGSGPALLRREQPGRAVGDDDQTKPALLTAGPPQHRRRNSDLEQCTVSLPIAPPPELRPGAAHCQSTYIPPPELGPGAVHSQSTYIPPPELGPGTAHCQSTYIPPPELGPGAAHCQSTCSTAAGTRTWNSTQSVYL